VRDGGVVSTQSYGQGDAGNLTIRTTDSVEVTGNLPQDRFTTSSINASVGDDRTAANGNAGNITITTQRLRVTGGSDIATSIFGIGNAGDMKIYATDFIELDGETPLMLDSQGNIRGWGGGLTAEIESLGDIVGRGRGGNMFIETGRLSVSNGSKVQVANFGEGDAGNLFIRANSINVFSTFSEVGGFSTAINAGVTRALRTVIPPKSSGGTLTIETGRLTINDSIRGSEVTVSTAGLGNAGKASIRADVIEVIGEYASLRANVTSTADGKAGDLILNTRELKVLDGGTISVANDGNGIAGNLEINAQNITLNNQGAILGTTRSGQGGDLTLNVEKLLLMRRNSLISTTAGMAQAGGNGGNIFLNAPKGFVIAVSNEDSDIRANAFTGRGGNIQIAAQGIYGIGFRTQQTNLSDITASSQLGISGNVTLNTPDVDPSRGTIELPATVLDRSNQIAQTCAPQKVIASSFVRSGRGSLPPSPLDTLQGEPNSPQLATADSNSENRSDRSASLPTSAPIIEAQGWVKDAQGNIKLVANPNTALSSVQPLGSCH
jgi:large exoprotein involved in heme utilization and adhesion